MEIRIINNLEEYTNFILNNKYIHYMKSINWANIKKEYEHIYVGFYTENKLIGTALIFKSKSLIKYMYIPKGMCIDYSDKNILKESLELLKGFAIKQNVAFLRIDPNVIRVSRDISGNKIEGINNEFVTECFKECNFKHKGYGYGYDGSFTNRFTLIINIDKDINLLKSNFTKQRQTSLNRHDIIGLDTHIGDIDDIKYICEFEKELSKLQGFKPHSFNFFKNIINNFPKNSRIYISKINLDKMIEGISNELSSKKYIKDIEARLSKEKELNIAKEFKNKYGSELVIAAGLFLFMNEYSWDLYTYNKKDCNFLKPVDNLHYFAIQDMKQNGVKFYDMCGFSGITSKDDRYYGLYNYKKSFNPDFIEMIGEFDFIINHKQYNLYLKTKKGFNRILRKLNKFIFKKD